MSATENENLEQLLDAIERVKRLPLDKVNELRTGDPKLSFGEAWEKARRESPASFTTEELPAQ